MLIHKQTMGVLDQYWSGLYVSVGQERVPQMIEYTLANTGLSPADWWEIPRLSRLGRWVRMVYPYCDPITDDRGELIDVTMWPAWRQVGLAEPPAEAVVDELQPTPAKKRRRQRRSCGLFADLLK